MLPAISELFTTKLDESLKKLAQPAGLVPAALFVLLNILILFPALQDAGFGPAVAFADLSDPWKLALSALITAVGGYVLVSSSASILRVLTGESWHGSSLYRTLAERERRRLDLLVAVADDLHPKAELSPEGSVERADYRWARWMRDMSYPDRADVAPTALGNAFASTVRSLWRRYRIDLSALGPQHLVIVSKENQALATKIDDEKASIDVLANLAFVLVAFSMEALVVNVLYGRWLSAIATPVLLMLGYVSYRGAIARARTWGDSLEVAFDLYRDKLLSELDVPKPADPGTQRKLWEALSKSLSWDEPHDEVFKDPKEQTSSVSEKHSENVKVTVLPKTLSEDPPVSAPGSWLKRWHADYLLLVSNTTQITTSGISFGTEAPAQIFVTDKDVKRFEATPLIRQPPAPADRQVSIRTGPPGESDSLLWLLRDVSPGAALPLDYRLTQRFEVKVQPSSLSLMIEHGAASVGDQRYTIRVRNVDATPLVVVIMVLDHRLSADAKLIANWRLSDELTSPAPYRHRDGAWIFEGPSLPPGKRITLGFVPTRQPVEDQ